MTIKIKQVIPKHFLVKTESFVVTNAMDGRR